MTDIVTGNQIDIAAFDSGMSSPTNNNPYKQGSLRYNIKEQTSRLPRFLNKQYQRIPEDVRDFGEGMTNVVVQGAFGEGGLLRSEMNPLGLQPVDALKAVDAVTTGVSDVTGIDKGFLEAVELAVPFVPKGGKIASKVKGRLIDEATDFAFRNAPEGSVARMVYDTGGGIVPASKQTKAYLKWDRDALKHFEKTGSMKGYRNYTDPATGLEYRKGMESGQLKNIGLAGRRERGAKRTKTTKIDKDRVSQLMKKYNQPPEMVGEFLEYQRIRKKSLDNTIKKINERIKKNPQLYLDEDGKVLKASLGHGKAAKGYTDSADVITNIDIENYRRNVKRSNLDEVSDEFNRGLGRSIDLEEEILKFLDKDLRDFHRTGGGLKLGRHQQDRIIDYVKRHKDVDIDWKSERSPSGKQLFKSKEEFLQNEATQLFRGDKHGQTMYDLKSRGF